MEHELNDVVKFERPAEPRGFDVHWRWYCSCGVVGGKRQSEESARRDHARHATDERRWG